MGPIISDGFPARADLYYTNKQSQANMLLGFPKSYWPKKTKTAHAYK